MIERGSIVSPLLTLEEAAEYLRLDEGRDIDKAVRALERYIDRGEIKAAVIGRSRRVSVAELDRFISAKTGASDGGADGR
ncbi:MAG: helix-turn-helix domain-containing protein [Planctomycetota bacterium]|jgi:hypothetical protein